jgi:hypothetical protein
VEIDLKPRVDVGDTEMLAARFRTDGGDRLRVSLNSVDRFDLLAETRLLALLAAARRRQLPIELHSSFDIDVGARSVKRLVDLFADTLGGVVLAQLASSIVDGSDTDRRPEIGRLQLERAAAGAGSFGFGSEKSAPIVDLFGGPPAAAMVTDQVGTEFDPLFRAWIASLHLEELQEDWTDSLVDFTYEAFDNTRRHGVRTLDGGAIEGVRFILLRSLNLAPGEAPALAERIAYPPLSGYVRRLGDRLRRPIRLAELTIADCGIGIPATLAGTTEIYRGDYTAERDLAVAAFERGRTSRRSQSRAGQGLAKAYRATRILNGLIALRTGRTHLFCDFTDPSGATWRDEEVALMPGTALSLLFPWRDQSQLQFEDLD